MAMRNSKRLSQSVTVAQATNIQHLGAAFAALRRSGKPVRRIPDALRVRAVRAFSEGVPEGMIREACGLSWIQLKKWRSTAVAHRAPSPPQKPRVLSVVDDKPREAAANEGIQIGIGPWRVSVTHAG